MRGCRARFGPGWILECGSKALEFIGLERLAQTEVRQNGGHCPRAYFGRPQNFGTQVVSVPREKCLLQVETTERAIAEGRLQQSFSNSIGVERRIEDVRAQSIQKRVCRDLLCSQHFNRRGAVKQRAMCTRVQRYAELARCVRHLRPLRCIPTTVQLIVTVKR